jgi:acyl dehydratase
VALDYDQIMGLELRTEQQLTRRDTILYALGVGAGADDPTDPSELQFVYEEGLKALPTMAVVLATPGFWARDPAYGLDWKRLLHGEQSTVLHAPLPVEGALTAVFTTEAIYDKGPDKGAVVYSARRIYDGEGRHVATSRQASFFRGDGGFGGSAEGQPKPHAIPERSPDLTLEARTRPEQALVYRLSGDYNPLHIDPDIATQAGFKAPILHGLGSYGVVGRVLLKALCDYDPTRLKRLDVRFSSPVYPGETLQIEVWREGAGRAAFRARVPERNVIVLQNGFAEFGE